MHKTPQLPSEVELFAAVQHAVRESIEKQIALGPDVPLPQLEAIITLDAREIARRLLQGSLDLRSQRERAAASPPPSMSPKARFRSVSRSMRSTLGLVELTRLSWTDGAANDTVVPLDSTLHVVPERNTLGVRRKVAEHVADLSFDRALKRLREEGIAVAKRQAEQAIVAIAQDYDDFYAWGRSPADETDVADETLLAMSLDSKGVRVIFEGLRPDTQREAAQAAARPKGDPMAQRKERTHDRRMAVVAAVWDQTPTVRSAEVMLDGLLPKPQRKFPPEARALPKPQNKRVWTRLEEGMSAMVKQVFDEAERRDPLHQRRWVVLIDGAVDQREAVEAEARRRGVRVTIVTDLIHVIHYLWGAGKALSGGEEAATEEWVREAIKKLLTRDVYGVVSGMRQSATKRDLRGSQREAVEKCAKYLEQRGGTLRYVGALARGMPIATGVIEGACRSLVQDRMGITGARWSVATAEAVLRVRALVASGHWEQYLNFHHQQEHTRNHSLYPLAEAA
jgi:hypothetical protein